MIRYSRYCLIATAILLLLLSGSSFAAVSAVKTGDGVLAIYSGNGIVISKTDPVSGAILARTVLPCPTEECGNAVLVKSPEYIFAVWSSGDLLFMSRSRDNGNTWERPSQVFRSDQPFGPVKVLYTNNNIYVFYSSGASGLHFIYSPTGLSFSQPQNIPAGSCIVSDFNIASAGSNIIAAWGDASAESIFISESADSGSSWLQPQLLRACDTTPESVMISTGESGCVVSWTEPSDEMNDLYACSVPQNISGPVNLSLVRTSASSIDLCSSASFCKDNVILSWSEDNSFFIRRSADAGTTWKTLRLLYSWPSGKKPASVLIDPSGYYFIFDDLSVSCLANRAPVPARIVPGRIITNNAGPVLNVYPATDADHDELSYNVKVSCITDPTAEVSSVYPGGTSLSFASALEDGTYAMTIEACDGLSTSSSDAATLIIDTVPPKIFLSPLIFPTAESGVCIISGSVESGSALKLNGVVLPAFNGAFVSRQRLGTGTNIFTLEADDQAGNISVVRATAYFDPYAPQISVIKPGISDWFKPGSTIAFNASVTDRQSYIDDESQADVTLDGALIQSSVFYDLSSGSLSGFIMPPQQTLQGKHILTVKLAGSRGNPGQASCQLNIDPDPPVLNLPVRNGRYSVNTCDRVRFGIVDDCSGPDIARTTLRVSRDNATVEGQLIFDQNGQGVIFVPSVPLTDGLYQITMSFRDKAGNVAAPAPFDLMVDTSPLQSMSAATLSMSDLLPCPDPFNPDKSPVSLTYNVSSACHTVLSIFDNRGRLVWKKDFSSTAGANSFAWDGKSIDGTPLGNGVYILMAISNDSSSSAGPLKSKVIILR